MYEDAQEIFQYLPIRKNKSESDYIEHLWQAFSTLDVSDSSGRSFAVMPFHLLFMLSLQYRILRIWQRFPEHVDLFISGVGGKNSSKLAQDERSVFDLALINERSLPNILSLINCDPSVIKSVKGFIDDRNDKVAHAKGYIIPDPDLIISRYINSLQVLQPSMQVLNDETANQWSHVLSSDDNIGEFIEYNLARSYLCPADFSSGLLADKFAPHLAPGIIS